MKLIIHSQVSMVARLKFGNGSPMEFGNGEVGSYPTLLGVWLVIHAGIRIKPYQ